MSNPNKETIISPIAIDLGAANTGVQFLHDVKFLGDKGVEIANNIGRTFVFDAKKIQFLQKERTIRRHALRGLKRRKMVKRLLRCFLNHHKIEYQQFAKEIDFLNGLLNRRGYTYAQEGQDLEFLQQDDVSKVFFALLKDTKFKDTKAKTAARFCLEDMAELKPEDLKECKKVLLVDMDEYERLADEKLGQVEKKDIEGKKERKELLENLRKNLEGYVEKLIKEQEEGAKHRKTYFKNIQKDFFELPPQKKGFRLVDLLQNLDLKKEGFVWFLGNISNLQLRTLRKYFNKKKAPDVWDEKRLEKYVKNSIIAWHCKEEDDVRRRRRLLRDINKKGLYKFLTETDPEETIPPYEDQNNRRPPRCASIYLNPCGLDNKFPQWETVVEKFLKKHKFSKQLKNFTGTEETQKPKKSTSLEKIRIPEFEGKAPDVSEKKKARQKNAHILQRILDISRDHDQYQLRDLVRKYEEQNKDIETCVKHDGFIMLKDHLKDDSLCKKYIKFAHVYYSRIDEARRGVWDNPREKKDAENNIFFCCNHNPPHKNKIDFALVNNLLGTDMDEEDLEKFKKDFWRKKEKKVGGKTFMSFSKTVEETRKLYGNAFRQSFINAYYAEVRHKNKNKGKGSAKDLVNILITDTEKNEGNDFFQRIQTFYIENIEINKTNRMDKTERPKDDKLSSIAKYYAGKLYIVAQMYQILETDVHGFSKNCKYCVSENGWRMQEEKVKNKDKEKEYMAARAVRLSNDSVVPFDGFLGRYLERLAKEIVEVKIKEQLKDTKAEEVFVPICIEQNKFEFEETLAKQKGPSSKDASSSKKGKHSKKSKEMDSSRAKDKNERIRDSKICPYCGKSNEDGDIDHIISRSSSLKKHGTIFNSEANLIYTCRTCNREDKKDKKVPHLGDLDSNYLKEVFGEQSNNIGALAEEIQKKFRFLNKKRIINFMNLDNEEKKYIKHGLFIEKIRNEIIDKVLNTRIRTLVNGTQAYLVKRINQELLVFGRDRNVIIRSYPFQVPASDEDWMQYASKYESSEDRKDKDLVGIIKSLLKNSDTSTAEKKNLKSMLLLLNDASTSADEKARLEDVLRDLQSKWLSDLAGIYQETRSVNQETRSIKLLQDLRVQWLLKDAGTSITANRALLAIEKSDYKKQEIQGKQSHIVDAAMTFISILREPRRLEQILERTDIRKEEQKRLSKEIAKKYNRESSATLYKFLPLAKDMDVEDIKRKNQEDGKKIWEGPVFNDTLYGESFYPVYLHVDGKLDFGYRHPNGTREKVDTFGKKRNSENDFNLLVPFFRGVRISDYQEAWDALKKQSKQKYQVYIIDKRKVFAFYEDVFYSREGHNLLDLDEKVRECIEELLEKLWFYTLRKEILELTKKNQGPSNNQHFMYQESARDSHKERVKEEIRKHYVKKEEKGKRTQQRYESALEYLKEEKLFGANCGKYDEDFWKGWNAWKKEQDSWKDGDSFLYYSKDKDKKYTVCTREEAEKRSSEYAKKQKEMIQTIKKELDALKDAKFICENEKDMEKYEFVSTAYVKKYKNSESKRAHRKRPTKFSIKQVPAKPPGSMFRVKRKDSRDRDIYQLCVIDRNCSLGTNLERRVLLRELSEDGNLVPAGRTIEWWKNWQPYREGLEIKKLRKGYLKGSREEIEKVYYDLKLSNRFALHLYFSEKNSNLNYKKFLNDVKARKMEDSNFFIIFIKDLIYYFDKKAEPKTKSEIKFEKDSNRGKIKLIFKHPTSNEEIKNPDLKIIVESLEDYESKD